VWRFYRPLIDTEQSAEQPGLPVQVLSGDPQALAPLRTQKSVDQKRGLVFAPTGAAAFDFYGANRIGDNLFANTLLALKADTGERVWHFQFVKHDVWDRDIPPTSQAVAERFINSTARVKRVEFRARRRL
jgi:hypothetical protein